MTRRQAIQEALARTEADLAALTVESNDYQGRILAAFSNWLESAKRACASLPDEDLVPCDRQALGSAQDRAMSVLRTLSQELDPPTWRAFVDLLACESWRWGKGTRAWKRDSTCSYTPPGTGKEG